MRVSGKAFKAFLAIGLIAVLAAGCGSSDKDDSPETGATRQPNVNVGGDNGGFPVVEPGSGEGLKIGYISYGETVPTVNLVTESIRAAAEAAGAELVFCDAQIKADVALQCAQNLKTQGVDAVLNYQPDAATAPAICAALPDVPVIAISVPQDPCQDSFVGVDNKEAGLLTGQALGAYFKSEFDCEYDAYVSLEASAAGQVNEDRMGGIKEGFEESCGPVHDEKVQDANQVDTGRTVFTDILTSLPSAERIVVVGIQDAPLIGAIAAAKAAGREDQIFLGGQAADAASWCEIKTNPNWIADTGYFPEHFGELAVPAAIAAVGGETLEDNILIPIKVLNADNIGDYYDVNGC